MNFIFPTQYVIHRSLKVKWCLSEWISDLKSCSSTLFDSFVTLLTTLPFPSFAGKGPFLSSFHRIHPNLSRFVSHLGAISDIRVLRSGLRPRSCASSGTRRSGMRRWAASVEVDMDQLCLVLLWFLFGPIVQYVLIVDIMFKFLFFEYQCDLFKKIKLFCLPHLWLNLLAQLFTCGASTSTTGGRPTSCSLGALGRGLGAMRRWDFLHLRFLFNEDKSHPSQSFSENCTAKKIQKEVKAVFVF